MVDIVMVTEVAMGLVIALLVLVGLEMSLP